jgi:hypothetical protein
MRIIEHSRELMKTNDLITKFMIITETVVSE